MKSSNADIHGEIEESAAAASSQTRLTHVATWVSVRTRRRVTAVSAAPNK
ncbi:MAG: hypothetical protein R3C49_27500 [Planctomycetaceae bacterium]